MLFYSKGRKITFECGMLIKQQFEKSRTIIKKGEIDLVSDADHLCESLFLKRIKQNFPTHSILSEEIGMKLNDGDYMWIVDPIDGTTNYCRRLPFFCISVGFAYKGVPQFGFVFAPLLNQFFEARIGYGALLNHKRIHVSSHTNFNDCFLTTGFPYNIRTEKKGDNINLFSHFSKKTLAVRRLGSAAIDLCYVACGIFDGYWELSLHPWDFAGGKVILEEAGGTITTFQGNPVPIKDSEILATNSKIHAEMIEDIRSIREK